MTTTHNAVESNSNFHTNTDYALHYTRKCQEQPTYCRVITLPDANTQLSNNFTQSGLVLALESAAFQQQYHLLLRKEVQIYYIIFNLTFSLHQIVYFHQYYEELDRFLVQYPWWVVRHYPLPPASTSPASQDIARNPSFTTTLIIQRLSYVAEASTRQSAAIRLQSAEDCLKTPLFVKTASSSWGIDSISSLPNYFFSYAEHIHAIYLTEKNNIHDNAGFVEPDQCFQLKNKHLCTFLPTTNCSMTCPDGQECASEGFYSPITRIYSPQNSNPDRFQHFTQIFTPIANFTAKEMVVIRTKDIQQVDKDHVQYVKENVYGDYKRLHAHIWLYNVAYKSNHHLGIRVQRMVQDFYQHVHNVSNHKAALISSASNHGKTSHDSSRSKSHELYNNYGRFSREDHCVAAHIRKGDRHIPGVDMIQWCKNHTKINQEGGREPIPGRLPDGQEISHSFWADMGCDFPYPFGAVTLQVVVNASLILFEDGIQSQKVTNDTKVVNIIVATDEHHLFKKELQSFETHGYGRDRVRIFVIPTAVKNRKFSISTP